MKLIKYAHACFVVEKDGQSLVVDPGEFTHNFEMPERVVGVVITHQHPDHAGKSLLSDIVRRYPDVELFTTDDTDLAHTSTIVQPGQTVSCGPFELVFSGGTHAQIDASIPLIHNVGVTIDRTLFYPGDSFESTETPYEILLLPVAAPWMKISETLDFVRAEKPRVVIPTHDAILSEAGQGIADFLVSRAATELSLSYRRLTPEQVSVEDLLAAS